MLVADGARRASLRESFRTPRPVPQGEPLTVEVVLPDVALTLPAGHRLLVAISASNAPRYEVNPAPATIEVIHGGEDGSVLSLPVERR
jgi:predicted acyl esterase